MTVPPLNSRHALGGVRTRTAGSWLPRPEPSGVYATSRNGATESFHPYAMGLDGELFRQRDGNALAALSSGVSRRVAASPKLPFPQVRPCFPWWGVQDSNLRHMG
jgi:hypothetical protein